MIHRLAQTRVHGSWTREWFAGHTQLADLFGLPPTEARLVDRAATLPERSDWASLVHRADEQPLPEGALVVLAGQQPVLFGGAALVAHKAATAIALARRLGPLIERPVVPVFLLATQDHDSGEVDHLDVIDDSNGVLQRVRCPLSPRHEMFARCRWDSAGCEAVSGSLNVAYPWLESLLTELCSNARFPEQPWHVAELLHRAFGEQGLRVLEAHRLEPHGRALLGQALADPEPIRQQLVAGARALESFGWEPSFDPRDPRPLVLESADGRRRRLAPDDRTAPDRLRERPEDFSPHAALRPIVQAAALPVVAQVAGPSELLYLGQARRLHGVFGQAAPVLVPRLEATRVPPDLWSTALEPGPVTDEGATDALRRLEQAAGEFTRTVGELDPGLGRRLERFRSRLLRDAERLAEAPSWRGHGDRSRAAILHPRGRPQDTVLAWLPDAWRTGGPEPWARHLVDLCQPLEVPTHVLHTLPESSDG